MNDDLTNRLRSELDTTLTDLTRQGWIVVHRTDTTAQLRRPKQWSYGGLFLLCLLPLIGGWLLHPFLYGVAVVGFAMVAISYTATRDELRYITQDELIERVLKR